MNKRGLHLIGDLYECNLDSFAASKAKLKNLKSIFSQLIKKYHFTELGHYYHFFGENAVTAVISLAESHLTFHTWPEDHYVSLDIFICHYSQNNAKACQQLFDELCQEIFQSKKVKKVALNR